MAAAKEQTEQQSKELGKECSGCLKHFVVMAADYHPSPESLKHLDSQKEETLGRFKALLLKSRKELADTRNQVPI